MEINMRQVTIFGLVSLVIAADFSCTPIGGIRVHLKRRAQHSAEDIKQLLECARLSNYLNHSAPAHERLQAKSANSTQLHAACRLELLHTAFSPFIGRVKLGEPAQEFEMLFDTGSDVLWVAHERCRLNERPLSDSNGGLRGYRNLFTPGLSKTCRAHHEEVNNLKITYANGLTFSGDYLCDDLVLEWRGRQAMRVPGQCFAAITQIDNKVSDGYEPTFDGIVGLAWTRKGRVANLMDTLLARKLIREPLFTVSVKPLDSRATDSRLPANQIAGELSFGAIDHDRYRGEIVWAPVTRDPLWEIRVDRIEVINGNSNETLVAACEFGCSAVVDTGTSFVVGPADSVKAINRALGFVGLPSKPDFYVSPDCLRESGQRKLRLVFHVDGRRFVFNEEAYGIQLVNREAKLCTSIVRDVEFKDGQLPYWLLGAPFIERFYTIFDYGNRRVGFAMNAD